MMSAVPEPSRPLEVGCHTTALPVPATASIISSVGCTKWPNSIRGPSVPALAYQSNFACCAARFSAVSTKCAWLMIPGRSIVSASTVAAGGLVVEPPHRVHGEVVRRGAPVADEIGAAVQGEPVHVLGVGADQHLVVGAHPRVHRFPRREAAQSGGVQVAVGGDETRRD